MDDDRDPLQSKQQHTPPPTSPSPPSSPKAPLDPHYFQWGLTAFCVIVASVLVFYLLNWLPILWKVFRKFLNILSPFIYGFVMAYLLMPIFNWLTRLLVPKMAGMKKGARLAKGISSILTLAAGVAMVGLVLSMVLPQVVVSIAQLLESMETYLNEIYNWVAGLLKDYPVIEQNFQQTYNIFSDQIISWMQNLAPWLVNLMTGVKNTVSVLFDLLIGAIIALYILNSKDLFCAQGKKILYSVFSIPTANRIIQRAAFVHRVFGGFITGKLIDSFIIGAICCVCLGLLDIPYTLLISVIVGITNIIPFFGPFIGAIPSALLILVISPIKAVYFIIFILLLQQFDGNILGPKILGDSTGLSSFWVMFAILVFGGIFGFVGMAIGVPLFAVLYNIATESFNNLLEKRGLSTDTNDYRGNRRIDPDTRTFVKVSHDDHPPISAKERRRARAKRQPHSPNNQTENQTGNK